MVDYVPKNWLGVIFQLRGSVLPRVVPRILFAAALGFVAAWLYVNKGVKLPGSAHTMVGVALGLLLVFRTNASFDRWWEGRKLLGLAVNRSRDLTRQLSILVNGDSPEIAELRGLARQRVSAFYGLLRQHLRGERDLTQLGGLLADADRARLEPVQNRPALMLSWITVSLVDAAGKGLISEQRLQAMDANVTVLHDVLGACERLLKTPIPFAYAQHIKTFLHVFCFTAPFALVDPMKWLTPVAAAMLGFALFGIDELGVEIEDPFGYDPNDLPLDRIGEGIETVTRELLEKSR